MTQVHDFNEGIRPDGLFWTAPLVHPNGIEVHHGAGEARMRATDLPGKDFFNFPNALFPQQAPADATSTFEIQWKGPVTSRGPVTTTGSSGKLVMSEATMTWSARNDQGFSFVSDRSPTTSVFAQLGRVRNGVFSD